MVVVGGGGGGGLFCEAGGCSAFEDIVIDDDEVVVVVSPGCVEGRVTFEDDTEVIVVTTVLGWQRLLTSTLVVIALEEKVSKLVFGKQIYGWMWNCGPWMDISEYIRMFYHLIFKQIRQRRTLQRMRRG